MQPEKIISLIGMMGAGKTTVGKSLADTLSLNFIDIDAEIEKNSGMRIPEIFAYYGEDHFRELENKEILRYAQNDKLVLSLGGGAFENEETRKFLLENSTVIYLKASIKTLSERIELASNRPLAVNLAERMAVRAANYEKAHFTIDAEREISDIIKDICQKLL